MAVQELDEQRYYANCQRPSQNLTPVSLEFPPNSQRMNYDRPHVQLEKVCRDISDAVEISFPTRSSRYAYDAVYVLLLRWEDDDLRVAAEIKDLQEVFENSYHFTTESWQIPSAGSYVSLNQKVLDFQKDKSKRDLLILYYGGHAVGVPHSSESVWAARRGEGPQLPWSGIQSNLLYANCDVLFMLDCCYASRNDFRGSTLYQGSKEVLAACSMEDKTTGVQYNSFTRRLIQELEKSCKAGEPSITAWQLHERLVGLKSKGDLDYTPRFFGLSGAKSPCIELRPLTNLSDQPSDHIGLPSSDRQSDTSSDDSYSTTSSANDWYTHGRRILVSINLVDWTKLPPKMQWERWLKENAPENIKSLKLFFQPDAIREPHTPESTSSAPSNVASFINGVYNPGDRQRNQQTNTPNPPNPFPIESQAMFDSDSTLLLLSLPIPVWKYLQHDPTYRLVGVIRSPNLLHHRSSLSRSPSFSEKVEEGLTKASRHWWWYKWYVGFLISAALAWNLVNIWRLGKSAMMVLAVFSAVAGALPPLGFMTFEDTYQRKPWEAELEWLIGGSAAPGFVREPANLSHGSWGR